MSVCCEREECNTLENMDVPLIIATGSIIRCERCYHPMTEERYYKLLEKATHQALWGVKR